MGYQANTLSLVGDVGGTNTRLALAEGTRLLEDTVRRFPNDEFASLDDVIQTFIKAENNVDCAAAAVAVAGPVANEVGRLTNLDWRIDKPTLASATQAERVAILNDLQAQGHAIDHVAQENMRRVLDAPTADETAAQMVIGVGTGFNIAPVYNAGTRRLVPPSEAGHANIPIRTDAELRLCEYVSKFHDFPAVEEVLSGRGLKNIYDWLSHEAGEPSEKSGKEIMEAFEAGTDPRAEQAAEVFARMLGTVAGNLSLIHLPFGGVYMIGGMARAFAPHLERLGFHESFRAKGRFSDFMDQFAVSVIEDDYAALTGTAAFLSLQS